MDGTIDTNAKYYTWYMTEDPTQRILAFQWWPNGEILTGEMTLGKLLFVVRNEPSDVWGIPKVVTTDCPWLMARAFATEQGCTVEVVEQ